MSTLEKRLILYRYAMDNPCLSREIDYFSGPERDSHYKLMYFNQYSDTAIDQEYEYYLEYLDAIIEQKKEGNL